MPRWVILVPLVDPAKMALTPMVCTPHRTAARRHQRWWQAARGCCSRMRGAAATRTPLLASTSAPSFGTPPLRGRLGQRPWHDPDDHARLRTSQGRCRCEHATGDRRASCGDALTSSRRSNDHAEQVGTRPGCNREPPDWWWVTAEADPAPDGHAPCDHKACAKQMPAHQALAPGKRLCSRDARQMHLQEMPHANGGTEPISLPLPTHNRPWRVDL